MHSWDIDVFFPTSLGFNKILMDGFGARLQGIIGQGFCSLVPIRNK